MRRPLAYTVLLISIIAYRSGNTLKNIILNKHDFPTGYYNAGNFNKDCTSFKVDGFKYCEDAAFWDQYDAEKHLTERHLIVTCDPGRKSWNTVMGPLHDPKPHGGLWIYPSSTAEHPKGDSEAAPKRITLSNYPEGHDFHPLGLDIWPSYGRNESNLYIVNHARHRTVIEHFLLNPSRPTVARHIRTISSPYFLSPNSIALTSPNAFYVSNDHLITRRLPIVGQFLPVIESILGLPLGFVSHVTLSPDKKPIVEEHAFAALFIPFPNGLALLHSSSDSPVLAVASSSLAQVRLYARDPATNKLSGIKHTIPVPFAADNVRFSDDGTLFVAGHPHFPTLTAVAANKPGGPQRAPSWAMSIPAGRPSQGTTSPTTFDTKAPISAGGLVPAVQGLHPLETVFQSNGDGFSSSSTVLRDDVSGALYVSGLYAEDGVLVCRPRQK
ncbi:hypothetical protein AMATHDRAFT_55839 [Amanita thiersii Skay4041]|uniref:SMP-30/Gluconolactonase/LRE-like region domain-containing protein n=1 Tax=Amanita thiersii Skay4041 TaxID=703135 RepID=A0A2A9NUB0_9AGAR|nr:hypothetical protein AMATHDRAFT_55839 [Amanita thiersii Skay4041]